MVIALLHPLEAFQQLGGLAVAFLGNLGHLVPRRQKRAVFLGLVILHLLARRLVEGALYLVGLHAALGVQVVGSGAVLHRARFHDALFAEEVVVLADLLLADERRAVLVVELLAVHRLPALRGRVGESRLHLDRHRSHAGTQQHGRKRRHGGAHHLRCRHRIPSLFRPRLRRALPSVSLCRIIIVLLVRNRKRAIDGKWQ